MVFFNYALRKLNAKIVYYGPGLCGKTTNLQWIHDHFEGGHRGDMISLATEGDRTIFFDLLPLEIGKIRGLDVTLQLYTVPGQVHYNSTRQLVLKGADGVVFVADSQRAMRVSNADSWRNLKENLLLQGIELASFPHVLQFNKRDLGDIMSVDELDEILNEYDAPFFESVATDGIGVQETLQGIVKLVMRNLRDRYEPVGQTEEESTLRAPSPGGGLRPAAPVTPFRPPAPTESLAPPARGTSESESADRAEVSEEAVTHPSLAPPVTEPSSPWEAGPAPEDQHEPLVDHGEERGGQEDQEDRAEAGHGTEDTVVMEEQVARTEPVEPQGVKEESAEGVPAGDEDVPEGSGAGGAVPREEAAQEAPAPHPVQVGGEVASEPFETVPPPPVPLDEETTAPFVAPWAAGERPVTEGSEPAEDRPEVVSTDEPEPPAVLEEGVPSASPPESPEPGVPESGGTVEEPVVVDAEILAREQNGVAPVKVEDEEVTALPEDVPHSPGGEAEDLLRQALETPASTVEASVPSVGSETEGPEEERAGEPFGEAWGSGAEPEIERSSADEPPTMAGGESREPVVFGSDDPFAFIEETEESPVAANASAVVAVPLEGSVTERGEERANQLELRIEGTQALARSGDVRELDIHVPVPARWIGNHRMTLQLRLTLVPVEEDE